MFADCQYIVLAKYVFGVQLLVWQHVTVDGAPKKVPDPFSSPGVVIYGVTIGDANHLCALPGWLALLQ